MSNWSHQEKARMGLRSVGRFASLSMGDDIVPAQRASRHRPSSCAGEVGRTCCFRKQAAYREPRDCACLGPAHLIHSRHAQATKDLDLISGKAYRPEELTNLLLKPAAFLR